MYYFIVIIFLSIIIIYVLLLCHNIIIICTILLYFIILSVVFYYILLYYLHYFILLLCRSIIIITIIIILLLLSVFQGILVFDGATERSWRVVHATMYPHPDFSTYRVRLREFYVKLAFSHFLKKLRARTLRTNELRTFDLQTMKKHLYEHDVTTQLHDANSLKFFLPAVEFCGCAVSDEYLRFRVELRNRPARFYFFFTSRYFTIGRKSREEFHGEVTWKYYRKRSTAIAQTGNKNI